MHRWDDNIKNEIKGTDVNTNNWFDSVLDRGAMEVVNWGARSMCFYNQQLSETGNLHIVTTQADRILQSKME